MKYKVGDKVRVRSEEWYDRTKSRYGDIECGNHMFYSAMSHWCGGIITITIVFDGFYKVREDNSIFKWTDEMIEGLVEEETKPLTPDELRKKAIANSEKYRLAEPNEKRHLIGGYEDGFKDAEKEMLKNGFNLPIGYQFVDENGNIINATRIVLEKKKNEYPKTYEECCKELLLEPGTLDSCFTHGYVNDLLGNLQRVLICRDAYWKIAGGEMGLGKSWWEPDWTDKLTLKYTIYCYMNEVNKGSSAWHSEILAFPTSEMRDAFYENFKELIKRCKELL